jgi:sulfur-oxidizing protein SoxA
MKKSYIYLCFLAICQLASNAVFAQSASDEIAKYRAMLADGNPAELVEGQGEVLWKTQRGPNNVSLEKCDFGKGPGVIKGVYAEMPRYFKDVNAVMDFESRLVHCMVTLQGFTREEVIKKPYSSQGERATELEALTSYAVAESRGMKISVPQSHPKEKAAFARGEKAFFYRGGPFDFNCASCHSSDEKRIRLQDLPNLLNSAQAQKAFATWPAYRVSQGAVRTMQWRLNDCFRQQRFPDLQYGSLTSIDLITFLGVMAKNGTMDAPALKR